LEQENILGARGRDVVDVTIRIRIRIRMASDGAGV
jgi:hypothetical protein